MWADVLRQVQQLQRLAELQGHSLYYRGQRDAKWTLLSAIHRHINDALKQVWGSKWEEVPEGFRIELMRDVYKTLFHRFKAQALRLLSECERSDWGIVFAMQHLGLPTALLDWTESFICATYFAQRKRTRSDDAAIFLLVPEKLNERVVGKAGFVTLGGNADRRVNVSTALYHPAIVREKPSTDANLDALDTIVVYPDLTNERMVAQRSAFTLCGASFEPLEERYWECITKIVLPSADFDEVEEFLRLAGSTYFSFFPDLEGLRVHLIEEMDRDTLLAANDAKEERQAKVE